MNAVPPKLFRNLFLGFLLLFQVGALWGMLNIFDLTVMQNLLVGMPLNMEFEEVWARPAVVTARWVCGVATVGMVVFLPLWLFRAYVEFEGGSYWMSLMGEARARAAEAGNDSDRAVMYWALRIEQERDGHRPETVMAYLDTFTGGATEGEQRFLQVLRDELKDGIDVGGAGLREGQAMVSWHGADHDASELMSVCESGVEKIREVLFLPTESS